MEKEKKVVLSEHELFTPDEMKMLIDIVTTLAEADIDKFKMIKRFQMEKERPELLFLKRISEASYEHAITKYVDDLVVEYIRISKKWQAILPKLHLIKSLL